MRRGAEFLEGRDAALVYIARKLREALKLEELLTASEVDYVVEPGEYLGGFLFRTTRVGAFFYVDPDAEEHARLLLAEHGYKPAV